MDQMQMRPPQQLMTPDEKQMGLILHLAGVANAFAPPLGLIGAIILWQVKKDEMPAIDAHGKMVVNWLISSMIYYVISFILMFVFIGFIGILLTWLAKIIFGVIGAIKANEGELWDYPLTIKFIK